jgi:hypothetical protein
MDPTTAASPTSDDPLRDREDTSAPVREQDMTPVQVRAAVQAEREQRAKRRLRQTARDMVLSMAAVAAAVLLIVHPWSQPSVAPVAVPWQPVATAFAHSVSWPVLVPTVVPAGWYSNNARIDPTVDGKTSLHVGWVTSSQAYVAIEQSDTADVRYVSDQTSGGLPQGTVAIGTRVWQRYETSDQQTRSLVSQPTVKGDKVTYVVAGSAPWPQLQAFATTLAAS